MGRYFFHLRRKGGTALDDEGEEFSNIEDARESAVTAVRELVAARIKNGDTVADEYMDVADETGTLLFSLSFHDVVQNHLKK